MMSSSVLLYQCWPKKVSDVVDHFPSHRSDLITIYFMFPS